MHLPTTSGLRSLQKLVIAALAASACAAWADEPTPFYFGAKETLVRDSNVYRIPDGPRDYYSITTLLGGFDQKISRQRLYADASVSYTKFKGADDLDNTSYGVKAGWDWATIENLTGSFYGNANRNLVNFYGAAAVPDTTKNLVSTDQLGATIRWGGEGLLTLEGDYAHSRVKYSAPDYFTYESSADTGSIGGYYRVGASLRLGIAARETRTRVPYAVPLVAASTNKDDYVSNTTNGHNIDFIADWRYSEQTSVKARLSATRQTNSRPEFEDFSGTTGGVTASYAPTAKLRFEAQYLRDAGTNANFFNVVGAQGNANATPTLGLTQGSKTADLISLGVRYAATAKINATLDYGYRRAKTRNNTIVAGVVTPTDETDSLSTVGLGVTYDVTRAIQLGCNLGYESRDVTGNPGFSYKANTVACSAQLLVK